ncbi:hypothetical protein BJ912DRAFT_1040141 [Pholiota molesta]|nr:hypothetical protein BJ912DRAFT_1040141 [Pholiota molesta]
MGCLSWLLGHSLPPAPYIAAHCDSVKGIEADGISRRQQRVGWPVIALGGCTKPWVGGDGKWDGGGEWAQPWIVAAEIMGRCEAGALVVALGRAQGAQRWRVSDGGWLKRRATHLRDLPLVGSSLSSSSPGIHNYGGRILMGVGEWRGAEVVVEDSRSCSRQQPQQLCSTTTPTLDIEGYASTMRATRLVSAKLARRVGGPWCEHNRDDDGDELREPRCVGVRPRRPR